MKFNLHVGKKKGLHWQMGVFSRMRKEWSDSLDEPSPWPSILNDTLSRGGQRAGHHTARVVRAWYVSKFKVAWYCTHPVWDGNSAAGPMLGCVVRAP